MNVYIYISPICNVEARLLFREYIKIRDSLFSLFTWYQSQRENLIYFFSDRVSFRSLSSPPGTLRRRISSSPPPSSPPVTFWAALLQPETTDSKAHKADLHVGGNLVGKQHHTRRHAPPFSDSLLSTRRRGCPCRRVDPFSMTGLHIQGGPAPSCCFIPLVVHPEPSLSTFLPILLPPPSVSHLLHGLGPFFLHLQFHSRDFKLHSCDSPSY